MKGIILFGIEVSRSKKFKIIWIGGGMSKTITYKVLYKNYKLKKGQLMGVLVERRKNLRGKSLLESGLEWAKSMFGQEVRDEHAIFVVPHELKLKKESYTASGEDDIQEDY